MPADTSSEPGESSTFEDIDDGRELIENQLYTDAGLNVYFKAQGARIDKITWGDKQIAKDGFTLGRVANRIAQDKFTLNDQQYSVAVNNNGNSLHGGSRQWNGPFANANWTKVDQTPPNAAFSLRRSLPGGAARGLVSRERSSSFSRERASSWDTSVSGREFIRSRSLRNTKQLTNKTVSNVGGF